MTKRLSALAQLVALHGKHGVTETKELVALTGYSRRAIVAAKCEAGCSLSENPAAQPVAHQQMSPPPKKKGLPHTPSKEKYTPTPSQQEEEAFSSSSASPPPAASPESKKIGRPIILSLSRCLNYNCPRPDHSEAERILQAAADIYGVELTTEAAGILIERMIDGEDPPKPGKILQLICRDLKEDGGRKKKPIPLGAIDLGGGHYLSRW